MMKTIWKYPLVSREVSKLTIDVPIKAVPLHIDKDYNGVICLWMAVDPDKEKVPAIVTLVGTGHELPEDAGVFINTFFMGAYVFHGFYREVGD